jgi:hypothetical protein
MSQKEIKYKYKYAEDYNPKYIHGVFGGVSPRGEIVMHFFMERVAVPKEQVFPIVNDQLGHELMEKRLPKDLNESAIRFIQNGVILDIETAEALVEWLQSHINQRRELEKVK